MNIKRKILAHLLIVLFFPFLLVKVQASYIGAHVLDSAGLLSSQELIELESKADNLMTEYGMDVVILTVDSLDGQSAQNKADNFYDENGYGDNGVLFLLAMEEREWYISTCGDAIYALTDYGIQQLGDVALPYLSDGDYYAGFAAFLNALPDYFDALNSGSPIDGYADYSGEYYHGDREKVVNYEQSPSLVLSLVIGLVVAAVTVLIMRSTMNTKRKQRSAGDYLKEGSYNLRTRQDLFLYSRVSKIRRQQNTSSGGGGSSVHRSSGGRSHGGGGGRF